jgi:hypothetical protein
MRSVLINLSVFFGAVALALGWAGLICLNSGEPDFTEQFWFFGLVALLASHAFVIGYAVIYKEDSHA